MKNLLLAVVLVFFAVTAKAQIKIGSQAPEIALPNAADSMVHLSSFRGKVVLVDFWASWCGPCRAANPAVVRLYNQYNNKGFQVIGVSIDSKKVAWQKAIVQDKINYIQLIDLAGWNSLVAEKYGVNQIPTSFLLDASGKIVAIDLEGKQLENKIKELLK